MKIRASLLALLLALTALSLHPALAQQDDAITLPAPLGPHAVGRVEIDLIDPDRPEIWTEDPDDIRELHVTVFYPAVDTPDGEPAVYMAENLREALAQAKGYDAAGLARVRPNSRVEMPLLTSEAPYSLLIFLPGYAGHPLQYTALLEEIASHGYVVAALSHPYFTEVTRFSDGRLVNRPPLEQLTATTMSDETVQVVADTQFAIDQLLSLNADHPLLAGSIDPDRIAIFGHSYGGAVGLDVAAVDARLKAVINLDGGTLIITSRGPVDVPYLFIESEVPLMNETEQAELGISAEAMEISRESVRQTFARVPSGYNLFVPGMRHASFLDWGYLHQWVDGLYASDGYGTIDPVLVYALTSDFMRAFLDLHLNAAPDSRMEAVFTQYPDVVVETYPQ